MTGVLYNQGYKIYKYQTALPDSILSIVRTRLPDIVTKDENGTDATKGSKNNTNSQSNSKSKSKTKSKQNK